LPPDILEKKLNLPLMPEPDKTPDNQENEDYYFSPEGYMVFTEKYHLKRGYCCMSGCRHCPYGFNPRTGSIEPSGKK
jgi:hypothetical protein